MTLHELHARLGSAEAMARIVGCKPRIVQMWLKGTAKPPAHMLRLLHLAVTVPAARTELERLAGPKPPAKRPYKRRTTTVTIEEIKPRQETHKRPVAAGFIVWNMQAIWGVGATEAAAWTDYEKYIDSIDRDGYQCHPATAALIEQVNDRGGDIMWRMSDGIACTVEEATTAQTDAATKEKC